MEHAAVVRLLRRNKSYHLKWKCLTLQHGPTDYIWPGVESGLNLPGCFFLITSPDGWWIKPGWSWFVFFVSVIFGCSFGSSFSSACRRKIISWSNMATQWAFVESWAPIVSGSRCFFFFYFAENIFRWWRHVRWRHSLLQTRFIISDPFWKHLRSRAAQSRLDSTSHF